MPRAPWCDFRRRSTTRCTTPSERLVSTIFRIQSIGGALVAPRTSRARAAARCTSPPAARDPACASLSPDSVRALRSDAFRPHGPVTRPLLLNWGKLTWIWGRLSALLRAPRRQLGLTLVVPGRARIQPGAFRVWVVYRAVCRARVNRQRRIRRVTAVPDRELQKTCCLPKDTLWSLRSNDLPS